MTMQLIEVTGSCPNYPAVEETAWVDIGRNPDTLLTAIAQLLEFHYGFTSVITYDIVLSVGAAVYAGEGCVIRVEPIGDTTLEFEAEVLPDDNPPRQWPIEQELTYDETL